MTNIRENTHLDNFELHPSVNLAPVKYTGGQLYTEDRNPTKYCIGIDWFEATIEGVWLDYETVGEPKKDITFSDGDIVLSRNKELWNGTKWYSYGYNIYLHGEYFGHILTSPRTKAMQERGLSQLKVDNSWLYRRGWIDCLEFILKEMNLRFASVTRLDCFIDGKGLYEPFKSVASGKLLKVGKMRIYGALGADLEKEPIRIGSAKSPKYGRVYRKSEEIKTVSQHKTYIPEFWNANGMADTGDIDRLELTFRGEALSAIVKFEFDEKGNPVVERVLDEFGNPVKDKNGNDKKIHSSVPCFDWRRIDDASYIAGVMKVHCKKWLEFVEPGGAKNISRKDKIQVVDWAYFNTLNMNKLAKTKTESEKWHAQRASKKLLLDAKSKEYLQKAVRRYFEYEGIVTELFGDQFDKLIDDIPIVVAFAVAKEHGLIDWLEMQEERMEPVLPVMGKTETVSKVGRFPFLETV